MEQAREIAELRNDVNSMKEVIENLAILMNKKLIKELQEEAKSIESGEYLTKEEFERKHKVKIN